AGEPGEVGAQARRLVAALAEDVAGQERAVVTHRRLGEAHVAGRAAAALQVHLAELGLRVPRRSRLGGVVERGVAGLRGLHVVRLPRGDGDGGEGIGDGGTGEAAADAVDVVDQGSRSVVGGAAASGRRAAAVEVLQARLALDAAGAGAACAGVARVGLE